MWLDGALISALTGVSTTHPQFADAIGTAENLIETHTGCTFGSSAAVVAHVSLGGASLGLFLPRADITAVSSVTRGTQTLEAIYGTGVTFTRNRDSLELLDAQGQPIAWHVGRYTLNVTQGFATVPGVVSKAASLLVAWFLDLSDADRSRFDNLSIGDFAGTMRRDAFPVPEAEMLLAPFCTRGAVALW
ncbi:MAG: hypothetical protein HC933_02220 [Pleurocapsa sp. SU_196_0]|nr:hypothetical protein [Pleurocapsa sp. SU_196_0]